MVVLRGGGLLGLWLVSGWVWWLSCFETAVFTGDCVVRTV